MGPILWHRIITLILILFTPSFLLAQEEGGRALHISDAAVASGVENLVPQGVSDVFSSDVGTLYAFSKVDGAEGETQVFHKWFYGEKLLAEIPLPVRSKSWRTYSSKIILPEWTGIWKVEIATPEGAVLQTLSFRVE